MEHLIAVMIMIAITLSVITFVKHWALGYVLSAVAWCAYHTIVIANGATGGLLVFNGVMLCVWSLLLLKYLGRSKTEEKSNE